MKENESILHYFRQKAKLDGVMLDVGAHVGGSARPFAELGWQVYCFEPEAANYDELTTSMAGFPKVTCLPFGVSEEDSENVPFYVSERHWGIHSLRPFHSTHGQAREIKTTRLDTFLRENSIGRVDFLKIDIEGADYLALQGMDFDVFRPAIVMTEFMDSRTESAFGYSYHDMVRYMADRDYQCLVFEYGAVGEYARKDTRGRGPRPEFLGVHRYPLAHTPIWGNMVFHRRGRADFEAAVKQTLARQPPMRWDWVPSPLRSLLRPAKRWLEARLLTK